MTTSSTQVMKENVRRHFLARWLAGCQTLGVAIRMEPENSDEDPVAGEYSAELDFVMPAGSRSIYGGGAFSRQERVIGRLQLTLWAPRRTGSVSPDRVESLIWRPMWAPSAVQANAELEGVNFYEVSPMQKLGRTETHSQFVTDVSFRWDET